MLTCGVSDSGVRVRDPEGVALRVRARDWSHGSVRRNPTGGPDVVVSGSASHFAVPSPLATVTDLDTGNTTTLGPAAASLGTGTFALEVDANIDVTARFSGPATARCGGDWARVAFPDSAPVRLGFRSRVSLPAKTVTVPPSPRGLAAALTHAAATSTATGPERVRPWTRPHPPRFAFDEAAGVDPPDPGTGVTVRLPPQYEALFAAAPLAYYLGARVETAPGADPVVEADGRVFPLDPVTDAAPALLRRTFWLDALVHGTDVFGASLAGADRLAAVGLDPEAVADADVATRLRRYADVPFDRLVDDVPTWHLVVHAEPSARTAVALPYLLDRLALVYPSATTDLPGRELMERSLDEFYRGDVPAVEVVKPDLEPGRVHGWLGPETPIDVFKAVPAAYENRLAYAGRSEDPLTVAVVLNDAAMAGEDDDVAAAYRTHGTVASVDVRRYADVSTRRLANIVESGVDHLHYIGHCETGGLVCADGTLAAADLAESGVRTFFLNACGSYYEGLDLLRKGSVAGAVTFRKVLDEQARTVGETFARLAVRGFSFERAIRLARRRIMMGKDYAVVGDGTHALTRDSTPPLVTRVEADGDRFRVTCEAAHDWTTGSYFRPPIPGNERIHVCGDEATFTLDRETVRRYLEAGPGPVIYEGTFYWPEDLAAAI
ncbi:MAG: hypothetical protein ABEJ70_07625 [Halobacteriaceae archaeon]